MTSDRVRVSVRVRVWARVRIRVRIRVGVRVRFRVTVISRLFVGYLSVMQRLCGNVYAAFM